LGVARKNHQDRDPPRGPQNEEHAQQNVADEAKPDKVDDVRGEMERGSERAATGGDDGRGRTGRGLIRLLIRSSCCWTTSGTSNLAMTETSAIRRRSLLGCGRAGARLIVPTAAERQALWTAKIWRPCPRAGERSACRFWGLVYLKPTPPTSPRRVCR
jgi:hypothetical protein